jgi:hypothetical protein
LNFSAGISCFTIAIVTKSIDNGHAPLGYTETLLSYRVGSSMIIGGPERTAAVEGTYTYDGFVAVVCDKASYAPTNRRGSMIAKRTTFSINLE